MKVNLSTQCLATIFIPTGLYAFKRIDKLRMGILLYVTTSIMFIVGNALPTIYLIVVHGSTPADVATLPIDSGYIIWVSFLLLVSFLTPMYYIHKWSKEWNSKINQNRVS